MGINRSGYYKWKAHQGQLNRYEQDRIVLTELLHEEHKRHPSLGYHRLARNILNEIIAHSVSPIAGDNKTYYDCLEKLNLLAGKKEEQKPQVVFHTDQGAVYSSRVFQHPHKL